MYVCFANVKAILALASAGKDFRVQLRPPQLAAPFVLDKRAMSLMALRGLRCIVASKADKGQFWPARAMTR